MFEDGSNDIISYCNKSLSKENFTDVSMLGPRLLYHCMLV